VGFFYVYKFKCLAHDIYKKTNIMSSCQLRLSEFPFLSGCNNTQYVIPVLNYASGAYENYNIDFADLLCSIPDFYLTGGTYSAGYIYFSGVGTNFIVDVNALLDDTNTYVTGATLSGTTLILTRNDGAEISTDLSSLLTGFINNDIFLSFISGATADAVLYTNSNPTYVTIGGIEVGSTFSAVTMQDMWTDLLYPNLTPAFTSFVISGASTTVDVGYLFSAGSYNFIWVTSNPAFIQPNTIDIADYTSGIYLATGLANDSIENLAQPVSIQKTIKASHTWRIYGKKTNNTTFYRNFYINWYWRRYWGTSPNSGLLPYEISGLTYNSLSNLVTGNFLFPANYGYKYIALPHSSGDADFLSDAATNLNIALAGAIDGYTDVVEGLSCKLMSITNAYGYTELYRVYRSKYQLGGLLTIKVE